MARSAQAPAQTPAQSAQQPVPGQTFAPPQVPPAVPGYRGLAIVLDPGHGGTDPGARGAGGVMEKDVVLQFARAARAELERQGFQVAMTRSDDSDPSYDDRAATANANGDVIFVTIHASSTGTPGTARAYYDQFSTPPPASLSVPPTASGGKPAPALPTFAPPSASRAPSGLIPWTEAQRPFADVSHRLADLLQAELDRQFSGSPAASTGAAVRDLRSVAAPAVAVEVSNVSVTDSNSLMAMTGPLAVAITRSIQAFRAAAPAGAK